MSTIREAYLQASSFLQQAGVPDPAIGAELLLMHVLGWSRSEMFLRWGDPFPAGLEAEWDRAVQRRAAGEPVQYIIGEQEFYGLRFHVEQSVLIPRPETELLVEEIGRTAERLWGAGASLKAADIGTGSGAIAVTLAVRHPAWRLHAVDLSAEALRVAKGNAASLGVEERVAFYEGDLLEPLLPDGNGGGVGLDIVVSNPPYIETAVIEGLEPQVRDYEPRLALDGGPDGLAPYRRLAEQLARLAPAPKLVGFEVGQGQAPAVAELLAGTGLWPEIRFVKDLAGIERHVIAVRSSQQGGLTNLLDS